MGPNVVVATATIKNENRRKNFYSNRVGCYFALSSLRAYCEGLQMGNKKNKKKVNLKGFPGYDLYLTIAIVIGLGILILVKACHA